MHQIAVLVSFGAVAGFLALHGGASAVAQDASPAADGSGTGGDATRAVLEPYLAALVARQDIAPFFADDVVLSLIDVGQVVTGRDAVAGAIVGLHEETFDATPEVVTLVVGEGSAALEAVFVGTHTGEFAGIAATGRQVRVPYTVFYDVADGRITELRIYGFASGLMAQLTAEATPTP